MKKPPIFVVGVDRSGTTLLALMLDSHSQIAIPYESHFIPFYYKYIEKFGDLAIESNRINLINKMLREPYVVRWDKKITIEDFDIDKCISFEDAVEQLYRAYAERFGKKIWGDKTPSYISELDILNKMFPNSKFIHIMRDGRDVALSIVKQWWGANDFMTALRTWREKIYWARKMLQMLPEERYTEIKFEDLIVNSEEQLIKIMDFLGLGFEKGMLDYTSKARKVGSALTGHHVHLNELPSMSQIYKWVNNLSKADQAVAYEIAGEVLVEMGYAPGTTNHPLKQFRKGYHRLRESYMHRVGGRKS